MLTLFLLYLLQFVHGDNSVKLYLPMTNDAVDVSQNSATFVTQSLHGFYTDQGGVTKPGYKFETGSYISVSRTNALEGDADFSLGMWVKFDRVDVFQLVFSHHKNPSSGCSVGYLLAVINGKLRFFFDECSTIDSRCTDETRDTAPIITANTWQFLGISISRSATSRFYINGVESASFTVPSYCDLANGESAFLGYSPYYNPTGQLYGVIGPTILYSRSLTSTEMSSLFTEITMLPTQSPSPSPTIIPTSIRPSATPSKIPTEAPTAVPSTMPSKYPTLTPTMNPSVSPTFLPTGPTVNPTILPSDTPTEVPTVQPSSQPTEKAVDTASFFNLMIGVTIAAFVVGCCGGWFLKLRCSNGDRALPQATKVYVESETSKGVSISLTPARESYLV